MEFSRVCCESHDVVLYMGCAPTQRVPLDLGPGSFEIFVDGERVLGNPSALALRTDQTHIVFVKRAGHVSELVVLERTEDQGEPPRLVPPRIDVRLRPLLNKEVTITIDERPDES